MLGSECSLGLFFRQHRLSLTIVSEAHNGDMVNIYVVYNLGNQVKFYGTSQHGVLNQRKVEKG
jgi:hypothetical protein